MSMGRGRQLSRTYRFKFFSVYPQLLSLLFLAPPAFASPLPTISHYAPTSFLTSLTRRGTSFEAPPLQKANLAFLTIFTVLELIQLSIAVSYLFRTKSPHLPPGIGGVTALIFLILSNGINVASSVARYSWDDESRTRTWSDKYILDFQVGGELFNDWVDPMIFLGIALVLRDRWLSYKRVSVGNVRVRRTEGARESEAVNLGANPGRVTGFMLFTSVMVGALFIVTTAGTAIYDAAYTEVLKYQLTVERFNQKLRLSRSLHQAYVGMGVAMVGFLTYFGYVVSKRAKGDKIVQITNSIIIPLLWLHAIARLIFEILDALLLSHYIDFDTERSDKLDFSSTFVFHSLFFVTMCYLCRLYLRPSLWLDPPSPRRISPSSRIRTSSQRVSRQNRLNSPSTSTSEQTLRPESYGLHNRDEGVRSMSSQEWSPVALPVSPGLRPSQ